MKFFFLILVILIFSPECQNQSDDEDYGISSELLSPASKNRKKFQKKAIKAGSTKLSNQRKTKLENPPELAANKVVGRDYFAEDYEAKDGKASNAKGGGKDASPKGPTDEAKSARCVCSEGNTTTTTTAQSTVKSAGVTVKSSNRALTPTTTTTTTVKSSGKSSSAPGKTDRCFCAKKTNRSNRKSEAKTTSPASTVKTTKGVATSKSPSTANTTVKAPAVTTVPMKEETCKCIEEDEDCDPLLDGAMRIHQRKNDFKFYQLCCEGKWKTKECPPRHLFWSVLSCCVRLDKFPCVDNCHQDDSILIEVDTPCEQVEERIDDVTGKKIFILVKKACGKDSERNERRLRKIAQIEF